MAWENSLELIHAVQSMGIPILSHDDDTERKVDMVHELGAVGSEFPVSLQAAGQARDRNMHVCMGAPNLLRGASTNSNVTAAEVLQAGLCDILVSDYAPESLPQAAFFAHRELGIDLARVLTAITSAPGSLLGTGDIRPGRMSLGAEADIVLVDTAPPWIRVVETWVGGRRVYAAY
jgi:alpha-D-ribose 1-methylphosphonate 5-triphosphate diphosphatase